MLEPQERIDLTDIIAGLYDFTDGGPRGRRVLITQANLSGFLPVIDLNGQPDIVAGDLLSRIEDFGPLPERSSYHALGALLSYLVDHKNLPQDAKAFLSGLIVRYALVDDPNRPDYIKDLRSHYGNLEIFKQIIADADLSPEVVQNAYRGSLHNDWPIYHESARDIITLPAMVEELGKAGWTTDGTVPMRRFADGLARHINGTALQKRLRVWVNNAAPGGRLANASQEPVGSLPAAAASSIHYLVIKLEPHAPDNNPYSPDIKQFLTRAWLISDQLPAPEPLHSDDTPRAITDVSALLGLWITRSAELVEDTPGDLIIEVFLPTILLTEDVDRWSIQIGRRKREVGTRYQVIVRSWERLQDAQYRRFWKEKWRQLKKQMTIDESWFYNLCDCDKTQEMLNAIYLMSAPMEVSDLEQLQVFDSILEEGIPIALWPRQVLEGAEQLPQLFKGLLLGKDLRHLPSVIFKARRDRQDQQQVWGYLAFLLDDADRLPPDAPGARFCRRYAPPEQART